MTNQKTPSELSDQDLDGAEGGAIVLEEATVSSLKQTELLNTRVIEFQDGDDYFLRK